MDCVVEGGFEVALLDVVDFKFVEGFVEVDAIEELFFFAAEFFEEFPGL